MNALYIVHRYLRLLKGEDLPKRTVLIGGKSAPGYYIAKCIIKLINSISKTINNDSKTNKKLKVI